ncbi:vacuolar protein sorting-associated protein 13D isoform X1 [Onychostruthus taczanowskii]|uniref:vacuolar protein sorting-associated protein 13D isoform X1 n=2 Tax=Onychostruthus taczanowskii TaxID=356909 RepID=UPI001B80C2FE|nr:vacuolar protein sorting-associated protein 13D isoform X1 [Onychostruthus taczanowskii]XP_041275722.1 vacuolar protein sorting-associated protein 13D isoform X1 [Onychostruthus taczanowskii]XP_041275723.1 vacuolar protein sorting-associated protein 13D isoform X1 [Onychostruthus taczanowskii]XP_041275724.1 vacuolar protein sorting-associated protein 13D isoform X1 [Onychostruthus taczanowskii]
MLEGLVAWVLNTYLGKYVNNLNTDQLSVALLKGAVELENLPLKKDALKELELPFEVKAGFIGKITLQIPFYRPHVDPWVISVSKLHLIGAPEKREEFDEEREKLQEREHKKALLLALEEKWKKEQQQKGESYWYSVTASVVTRIVENIELKIQDVHLRFEDGVTNPSQPFAFGICIKNVSMQNAVFEPVEKLMRKKQMDVADFSVYWDTSCTLLGDLPPGQLQEAMDRSMESRDHNYIMEPVCTSALLKRNCSKEPLRSRHTPRLECDIQLETIPLKLSQMQYQQIIGFLKELARKERQLKYRKWKPKVTVTENCREWWIFALNANLSEIREQRQRSTWAFALRRARDAVSYTDMYYSKLKGEPLSAADQAEMHRIEDELTYEELKVLYEIVHNKFHDLAESVKEPLPDSIGGSPPAEARDSSSGMLQYLQSWFPGWGGWYGYAQQTYEGEPFEGLLPDPKDQWNPEDILGTDEFFDPAADASNMNTFTKRDHVFAKLNLQLQGGSFTLLHRKKKVLRAEETAFMQLEFSGVKVLAESLPRRKSSLLKVQLGGLFLRDLATEGTIFPVLVFPNPQKEVGCMSSFGLQSLSSEMTNQSTDPDAPVFEMLYERNPIHSTFERRLEVSTRPLNIIYNPQAIKKVADFFYKGRVHTSGFGYQSELEARVAEAARRQYNKLKMQTKAEIRQTIDRLLVGDFIENSKSWTVCLDISAPQVIFPDDFKFVDPVLVVVDLGRILLTNSQEDSKRSAISSEANELSDEEYKTPLATPPNTPPPESNTNSGIKMSEFTGVEISEEQLQAHLMSKKMYERYTLSFMDLQIMVGRVKDNWKHVQDSDVGPTHVVEKFNVHLQLEHRLIYTSDPKYPGAVLSGNLPDLKIHINEDKMLALRNCLTQLSTSEAKSSDALNLGKDKIFAEVDQFGSLHDSVMNLTQSVVMLEQHTREVLVESQLLLAEFKVNCMQLGVESNGRYISVLKVFGTNAHFVKRPYDAEVSLTVHGLLLVDTMQTYGTDFDLLMASHKNLSFYVPTGSLRDSRAQSPVSGPQDTHAIDVAGLAERCSTPSNTSPSNNGKDQESLIKLEYQFVSAECPSMNLDSSLQVISLQVNNLDIILNPETIVELIGFLQKSFPKEKEDSSPQPLIADLERGWREQETFQSTYAQNTEVAVDIHWLNVLLLRTVAMSNGEKYGRKIATASIGGTKVNVSMCSKLEVNGSLGCLHLMDLIEENVKNQYVVSIGSTGRCENLTGDVNFFESLFFRLDDGSSLPDALSFTFSEKSKEECSLNLKMASLHYNHSAKFLKELTLSMDELEENFRSMLKSAASKVTTVLATKTAEYSEMVSLFDTTPRSRDVANAEDNEGSAFGSQSLKADTIKLILNVNIESPIVSIPRKPGSSELLVGHLGQISIQNFVPGEDESTSDRLQVEIKDIKMYSLNSSQFTNKKEPASGIPRGQHSSSGPASINSQEESHFTRHDFFESLHKGHAFHILNNTTIQFKLEKIPLEKDLDLTFPLCNEDFGISSIMKIEGKFVNPLQVVLAKHVYEQVLQTLDNLIYSEDLNKFSATSVSTTSLSSPSTSLHSTGTEFLSERKENGLFSHSSFNSVPNKPLAIRETKSFTQIQANFHISELQVQLSGDLTLGAQGLVSLKFQDFDVEFAKDHPQTLSIQIALRSLLMEDLLEKNPDSKYKNLMVSHGAPKPSSLAHKEYLSQSCPSVSNAEYPDMPRSLPSHMEEAPNVFQLYQRPVCASRKKQKEDADSEYPLTPPPSPSADRSKLPCGKSNFDDSLVHINIFLVDRKHPEFSSRYNKINRSVDVDFNCLDVLITLQTWVVILDFFGIGSTADNHAMKPQPEDTQQTIKAEINSLSASQVQEPVNTKLDLKVHSLSLVLNKATSELAKASVAKLAAHLQVMEGDLALQGSIGSLSLSDLTSHGEFYRERFTTSGEEALIFHIFKYGRPDPLLQRECDIRVTLRMASVQYVHTQRFQAEVVAFIQHFTQLQDVLGRQRAAIEGQTVRDKAQRASRVLLDIEAGAPVLLIPESSKSNSLIVANLGKLKVKNKFLFAGMPGTFSLKNKQDSVQFSSPVGTPKHSAKKSADESKLAIEGLVMKKSSGTNISRLKNEPAGSTSSKQQGQPSKLPVVPNPESPEDHICLLDCIVVDLQDMDIFAAERYQREYSKAVEDTSADLSFPSYLVRQTGGSLLTEPFRLKLKVERNLDKELSHSVADISIHGNLSSVHCSLDLNKYKLIRGLLENNLGEPIEEFMRPYDLQDPRILTVLSGEVYTSMSFLIDMVNVSLELMDPKGKDGCSSLARFDFKKSKLLFESSSDGTKSVNLVSHSMMAFDTRYAGQKYATGPPNVFNCIFQSSKNTSSPGAIQIELHFRSTKDSSSFTVVLNNLRVFLIFDWLLLVHDFLCTPGDSKKRETPHPSRQRPCLSDTAVVPKTVKSGVVTKRSSLPVTAEKQLEVKVNVTGTEFVVVEDMSCFDTNAIILKGTTVLTYKPKLLDRPFSGSLFGIEVFSCRLGNEQETALSIIDPVQIHMELIGNSSYPSGSGLLDAFNSEDFPPILEIQLQALDIRLSYNDVQLFLAIAKSIPQQTSAALPDSAASSAGSAADPSSSALNSLAPETRDGSKRVLDPVLEVQLARLQELGFSMEDCRKALLICQGDLKKAASWLFKNAEPLKSVSQPSGRDSQGILPFQFISGVEIKAESVCICFIDDCMDCDVPLAELTFSCLNFLQRLRTSPEGYARFTLSGDYYNRELSGWEPFIEPWPCSVSWQQEASSRLQPSRLKLEVKAKPRLDINITSVLIEQYTCTKQSWMEDYCKQDKEVNVISSEDWMGSSVDPPCFGQSLPLVYLRTRSTASLTNLEHQIYARAEMKTPKRRQPFVPFALRNHTGCTLWFATLTTTPTRAALSHSGSPGVVPEENGTLLGDAHNVSEWQEVITGEEVPFEFETRGKLRHRHTHDLRIHQLQVRVNGWEEVSPVSVDKVGTFFRYAAPDKNSSSSTLGSPISRTNIIHPQVYFSSLPPVRVVFEVTMEGSARKVITVRSALMLKNKLEIPMELRLDSPSAPDKPVVLPAVMPGDSFAIPLHLTSWRLQARPKGMGFFFCKAPIHWTNVQKAAEVCSSKRECHSMESENSRFFRFCVAIKKENYPDYMPSSIFSDSAKQIFRQPGHTIYLLPTVVICNLLPCELEFYVKGLPISGTLKPGKEAALHTADTAQNIELGVLLENFPICKELLIPPGTQNYVVRMRLYDANKRLLNLTIRIVCRAEGSLKILISAPYWLINKTGLPLIFRQDNAKTDAAGQFEEHELARSLSPLLFCYADKEQPNFCTMRVGKGIHPDGMPGWCQGFSLDGGSGVRALKVIQQGNRPGLIYNIGIDVKKGRGRYIDTCMVTFAPRYLLDNKSSYKLAFVQREFARGQGASNPDGYISTLPGSSVVFHWPRNDYDQLLCVRLMDVPNCIWSGGFEVNKNSSFHINMRDTLGKCYFLRVEITLQGATYRIAFSDTDQLPPPFRIDNFSKVPIVFKQHGVVEPRLSTDVKPMTSLDYAWDEPILHPFITLTVKGAGSSEVVCCMNDFQDSKQLYYENFIYIAATYTFSGLQEPGVRPVTSNKDAANAELVLDVSPKTQRVLLKKKEPGKRSQLWRMTDSGMLCHEGSSVPHNPHKPSPHSEDSSMILDIAGLAAVTNNRYEPLMLRRPDRRRSTTQTWSFQDGKLTCGIHGLVVQAKGGIQGLHDGAEVVLGPDNSLELLGPVPPEQQFTNQKMRPGSGVLAVRVIPDGPTRVLQITDCNQRRNDRSFSEGEQLPVSEQDLRKFKNPDTEQELEVLVKLEGGIGLSLVNKVPEELVFASLTSINVHYTQLSTGQVLELSVHDIQVDNQLLGTTQPFMLFLTPRRSENGPLDSAPAVQVNAMKFPSKNALTDIYKHLMITARKFTVQIEEKLLLKLLSFFGYGQSESEVENYDENLHEKVVEQGRAQKRYYFENLKISVPQIKLSVFTSNKLPLDLKALKSTLGFPLIRFEDAVINLDPFTRVHPYETQEFIINDILKHFQEELLSQAASILGSVDFLGNPMGLLNDVSEGVTGLIKYGNVGGLIRNVTHGVSNSAAKFAGTLSDGLGKIMDNRHQTEREYIRYHAATSGEHLVAGIHGLAHGIVGGLTSVITSTVEGVKTEGGVSGFISGLGKGLVGTVTKPVAGALDFASETAQALRDTTTLSGPRTKAERVRKPRCCRGPQGLLPRYLESQAEGQEQLFKLTDNIQDEFFIAVENIDSYCVLISSKAVYFLKSGDCTDRDCIFLEVRYDDLYHCLVSKDHGNVYIQLTKKAVNTSSGLAMPGPSQQRPMVKVKSEALAVKVSQEINYAKSLYYEQQLMLRLSENQEQLELDS